MSDDHAPSEGVDPADDAPTASTRPAPRVPSRRRHLTVLGVAVVGIVIGATLVLTGRSSPERSTPTTVATVRGPLLPDLGEVTDQAAAKALLGELDPRTLASTATTADGPSTTGSTDTISPGLDLSETGLQRCGQAIAQQSTDRSLGSRLAAGRLQVGRQATFVVSYELPASGSSPEGTRMVLVDARTCRVLGAVDH